MNERLLTAREVADMLGMSPKWVLREWQEGRMPGFKLGASAGGPVRFRASEVEKWLQTRRRGPVVAA